MPINERMFVCWLYVIILYILYNLDSFSGRLPASADKRPKDKNL